VSGAAPPDEAWGFEWGTADGNGGFVRLSLHREERVAWYWAYLFRPGLGPVVVRDHEVALPRGRALEIRADSLWSELVCETPGEHWSIGLEAFAVALDTPEDALTGEIGERIAFGLDLEWETTGDAAQDGVAPGRVRGEVLLGRDKISVDTPGPFVHTVGDLGFSDGTIISWDDGSWSWSQPLNAAIAPRSQAWVPVDGEGFVTREIGSASLPSQRDGIAWSRGFVSMRDRIE
jgi:hypothetical protein